MQAVSIIGRICDWLSCFRCAASRPPLQRSVCEIDQSIASLTDKVSEEIVLIGLHNAMRYIGQITGETTTEDMLTRIFATFCIGK